MVAELDTPNAGSQAPDLGMLPLYGLCVRMRTRACAGPFSRQWCGPPPMMAVAYTAAIMGPRESSHIWRFWLCTCNCSSDM